MTEWLRSSGLGPAGAILLATCTTIGSLILLVVLLQRSAWPAFIGGVIITSVWLFVGVSELQRPGALMNRIRQRPK